MSTSSRISLERAKNLQLSLSKRIIRRNCLSERVSRIAGVDVAYHGELSVGAAVVHDYSSMSLLETKISHHITRYPYKPTFLSFREIPPAIKAINKLRLKPDILMVDGHGLAHPRRLGLASHLGLVLDMPTVGVAKSLVCGVIEKNGDRIWNPVIHKGETVGAAVYTRLGVKPVYVSIGHKVSLETAVETVLHCSGKYRIPEPLRAAHMTAGRSN